MNLADAKKLWKIAKDSKLGGYKITGYLGDESVPVMPAEIDGVEVVAVGNDAFRDNHGITGMILPQTLVSLGKASFRNCSKLEEIELPDDLHELPKQLFAGCTALRRVKLPAAMITMEKSVFDVVSENDMAPMGLDTLEISDQNGAYCTLDGVLYNKDRTKLVLCPRGKTFVTLPETITELPSNAFSGMKQLKTVVLPRNLKKIGSCAFTDCARLETLDVPESVKSISRLTFYGCWNLVLTIRGAKTKLEQDSLIGSKNQVIRAPVGSPAEQYAQENNLTFIALE